MTSGNDYQYVKGLSESSILGKILSVDFSPLKVCSFDCVYCQLGRTTSKTLQRQEFHPVGEIVDEIHDWIEINGSPDYALLTGSGEPTLYSELGQLARALKRKLPQLKCMIYTNGSLLGDKKVREEISVLDRVAVNLNATDEDIFRKVCRPHIDIDSSELVKGIKNFRNMYQGTMSMDSILVRNLNMEAGVLSRLVDTVAEINPNLYIIRAVKPGSVPKELETMLRSKCQALSFEVKYLL